MALLGVHRSSRRNLLRMEEAVKAKLGYSATRPAAEEESTARRKIGSIAASINDNEKESQKYDVIGRGMFAEGRLGNNDLNQVDIKK